MEPVEEASKDASKDISADVHIKVPTEELCTFPGLTIELGVRQLPAKLNPLKNGLAESNSGVDAPARFLP